MKITKYVLFALCLTGFLVGAASAVTILATSQTISFKVTPKPYGLTLYLNGTTTTTYVGTINPGDNLNFTAIATPSSTTLGKTVTFFINSLSIGTANVVFANGLSQAQTTWISPALTPGGVTAGFDSYSLNATLS
jgi:hypothetical protein